MSARALDRTRGWNLSVGRGLLNGATCVVSKVGRDALEVHLLGPARNNIFKAYVTGTRAADSAVV